MKPSAIKILLIEDCETDAELITEMLRSSSLLDCSIIHVESVKAAIEQLEARDFDVVLSDLCLPDSHGFDTLTKLKAVIGTAPIIAITGLDNDELGMESIRAGASDYVPKSLLGERLLSRSIVHTIFRTKNMQDANVLLARKNAKLKKMYDISQQFVDNVSHEFRTPLTVIREFAAIVRDGIDGPITKKQAARLTTLIKRTDDLSMMVDDLLDTSRLKAGLLRTCRRSYRLAEIVTHVYRTLQPNLLSKQIDFDLIAVPKTLEVYCDEEKVRRILINLIVNAIKFTPVGGKITISAKVADKDRISLTVADNGQGIPADDLQRIFERFQQVEAHHRMASCKGFGLGLNIARALAALNLGRLQVSSQEGQGSHFSVLLPVARVDSIVRCYLDQHAVTSDLPDEISVIEVCPHKRCVDGSQESLDMVDDFLRSNLKSFDIVLRTKADHWVIYSCNEELNVPDFIERMNTEWVGVNRNHYGPPLPELLYKHKFTTTAKKGRSRLIEYLDFERTHCEAPVETPIKKAKPNKTVLVVEDEPELSNAIASRLAAYGFAVSVAFDGVEGLKAANETKPDAILLDIHLPRMNGLAVLRALKSNAETEGIPVIVLSASLQDQQTALDYGAEFFIQKPFRSEAIMSAIDSVLTLKVPSRGSVVPTPFLSSITTEIHSK